MTNKKYLPACFVAICCLILAPAVLGGERFKDNGDGTVSDAVLNVMWSKYDNQGDINWHQAKQWTRFTFPFTIEKQYANWRLPTLAELKSLYVDDRQYSGYETACGQLVKITPHIRLSCGWLWASETSAIQAYIFNYHRGYHYTDRMVHDRAYRVLPVRDLGLK